ncbi:MAG: Stp1/IreP family PP2C-type Ser/Thr phosphatase [Actinomycetota bacterium]
MKVAPKTDVGKFRDINEDSWLVEGRLFAVADGMGGHKAGEIASAHALETFKNIFGPPPSGASQEDIRDAIKRAVETANAIVHKESAGKRAYSGMGTTLTAAYFDLGSLYLAQVGDSRAYLFRNGELRQLTVDHTLVDEMVRRGDIGPEIAGIHPLRHVITRALGSYATVAADIFAEQLEPGDRILLCSDGLSSRVDDEVIKRIIAKAKGVKSAATALVKAALNAGGDDNITVVVAEFSEVDFD